MILGKLPVPGRPTIWIIVGQGPIALAEGAGGGWCLDIFTLLYLFSPLSPSLWETVRYRLKYCLKGPLNPKSTNQPKKAYVVNFRLSYFPFLDVSILYKNNLMNKISKNMLMLGSLCMYLAFSYRLRCR